MLPLFKKWAIQLVNRYSKHWLLTKSYTISLCGIFMNARFGCWYWQFLPLQDFHISKCSYKNKLFFKRTLMNAVTICYDKTNIVHSRVIVITQKSHTILRPIQVVGRSVHIVDMVETHILLCSVGFTSRISTT